MAQRTTILYGGEPEDGSERVLGELVRLEGERGRAVTVVRADGQRLGHCKGCFGCWVESPGVCALTDDGAALLARVAASDLVVLLGPLTFGGYSSALKRMVDRLLPLLLPHFAKIHGEIHHQPRYETYPRWVGVGVTRHPDARSEAIFRVLVGRNAINFHAPAHRAQIVDPDANPEALRASLVAALEQHDPSPGRRELHSIEPAPREAPAPTDAVRRALVLMGSPKIGPSSSAVIADRVARRLEGDGLDASVLALDGRLLKPRGRRALVEAAAAADLVVLACPLYVDALPTLVTLALETLAATRTQWARPHKRFFAIVNSGFPEHHQSTVALAIAERFAEACGVLWAGGLRIGGGEALSGGEPLEGEERTRGVPAFRLVSALDAAADALAAAAIPGPEGAALLAKSPIPWMPFGVWRFIYRHAGDRGWAQRAAANGVDPAALRARPLPVA